MKLAGRKILIFGIGRTGRAVAQFLAKEGADIIIADEKNRSSLTEELRLLGDLRDRFVPCRPWAEMLAGVTMIVPSPGVPPGHDLLKEGRRTGLAIISEIELAFRYIKKPVIAITGTNGKTTTTTLVGEMMREGGKRVFVGGNIGNPLIAHVHEKKDVDCLVVEVSSFQLQWIYSFRPAVAVLLNTSFDHVDYHSSYVDYLQMKNRLFENQQAGDLAVLNADEPSRATLAKTLVADVAWFSSTQRVDKGMFCDGDVLRYRVGGCDEAYAIADIALPGRHNRENIMAAIIAARRFDVSPEAIRRVLRSFTGLPHRIELVGKIKGVPFYNDSKATNVDAVARALEAIDGPLVLLMGGRDKGGDYGLLKKAVTEKVRRLILFGEARQGIRRALGGLVSTEVVETLKDAIETARREMTDGDTVLLSPACSSFDEFAHYEARGDFFREAVRRLMGENE